MHPAYRFDVRDSWGYGRTSAAGRDCFAGGTVMPAPERGLRLWDRIAAGNSNVSSDDAEWVALGQPASTTGFHADSVEAAQLA